MIPISLLPVAFFLGCAVGWVFGLLECRRIYRRQMKTLNDEIAAIIKRMPQ